MAYDEATQGRTATLATAQPMRARCVAAGCGAESPVDPQAWIGQGLAGLPLSALEGRLRCACGARRARLEFGSYSEAGRGAIYLFR